MEYERIAKRKSRVAREFNHAKIELRKEERRALRDFNHHYQGIKRKYEEEWD